MFSIKHPDSRFLEDPRVSFTLRLGPGSDHICVPLV